MSSCFAAGNLINCSRNSLFQSPFNKLTLPLSREAAAVDLELDGRVWGNGYMVVTRDSDVLTLWWNGVEQTTATPTLAGTADIDSLGVRKTDAHPYDGTISEVQVFSSTSDALTKNINLRLASIA